MKTKIKNGDLAISQIDKSYPNSEPILLKDKGYEIQEVKEYAPNQYSFSITDEENDTIYCISKDCAFQNGGDWIIKPKNDA